MQEVGTIYRDGRDTYLVLEADGEAYYFSAGRFHQGLTKFADKGCKLSEITALIPPEEAEGLK